MTVSQSEVFTIFDDYDNWLCVDVRTVRVGLMYVCMYVWMYVCVFLCHVI